MLEVIDKGSGDSNAAPLLFVHGAWHGAWCWDEHFLDFFADNGYRALALSLRGHGNSPTAKRLSRCSIADYVDDVVSVAQTLPTPPVVIGHSMGGFVVQKYLESNAAPAGVLLASIPPQGDSRALMRVMRRHPWVCVKGLVTGNTEAVVGTPALVREYLFSPHTPDEVVTWSAGRVKRESFRALNVDSAFTARPKPRRVKTHLLVLGAELDGIFTRDEVHDTARAYGTVAEIFPGIGHNMMVEPGWREVAQRIAAWLTDTLTPRRS